MLPEARLDCRGWEKVEVGEGRNPGSAEHPSVTKWPLGLLSATCRGQCGTVCETAASFAFLSTPLLAS